MILFTLFLFIYLYSLVEVTKIKGKGGDFNLVTFLD